MVRATARSNACRFALGACFDRRSPGKLALATRLARRDNLANQLIKTLVRDPEKACPALDEGLAPLSEKIMHKQ
jgi:hypothetical protein